MIQYILECIAFQLVFLIIYDLFLKRETFFQWNRVYLIGTYALSAILPWVKIEALKTNVPETYNMYPDFLFYLDEVEVTATTSQSSLFGISWEGGLFFGGMLLATLHFAYKLYQIYQLRKKGQVHYFSNFTRVVVTDSQLAFSYFKSIFLGDKVLEREHESIIKHELVHIRQRHSWDLLFFEVMRIVGWFNPLVYVYQNRVSELHEFIADAQVAKTHKKESYELLLSQVFHTQNISFVNQFFKTSLIKKRIVMLQKTKSKKIWQLKYLVLAPMVLGMLFYTSCELETKEETETSESGMVVKDTIFMAVKDLGNLSSGEKDAQNNLFENLKMSARTATVVLNDDTNSKIVVKFDKGEVSVMSVDKKQSKALKKSDNKSFATIDEVPVFPGCENEINKRGCFYEKIHTHIRKNFRYPEAAQDGNIQGKVYVQFIVNTDGNIGNLKMRGPHELLENEAKRIIEKLPKLIPGKHKGEAVNVPFSLPITFKLQ